MLPGYFANPSGGPYTVTVTDNLTAIALVPIASWNLATLSLTFTPPQNIDLGNNKLKFAVIMSDVS